MMAHTFSPYSSLVYRIATIYSYKKNGQFAICHVLVPCKFTCHAVALRTFRAKDPRRISRVLATRHHFRLQPRTSFRLRSLLAVWNAASPYVGARNEFNSTALRNWLRSHSSDKFLIVCPAPGELARSRRGDDHRSPPAG